jgi:LSD1 subclass zinc finger protein
MRADMATEVSIPDNGRGPACVVCRTPLDLVEGHLVMCAACEEHPTMDDAPPWDFDPFPVV